MFSSSPDLASSPRCLIVALLHRGGTQRLLSRNHEVQHVLERRRLASLAAFAHGRLKKVSMGGCLASDSSPWMSKVPRIELALLESMVTKIISYFGSCSRNRCWPSVFPPHGRISVSCCTRHIPYDLLDLSCRIPGSCCEFSCTSSTLALSCGRRVPLFSGRNQVDDLPLFPINNTLSVINHHVEDGRSALWDRGRLSHYLNRKDNWELPCSSFTDRYHSNSEQRDSGISNSPQQNKT